MENKKTILFLVSFAFTIFLISFVSAGLCKGSDGYYHDCNSFSDRYYRDNFHTTYNQEYYSESNVYSSSMIHINQDRRNYEELTEDYYEESNIEYLNIERDYSSPRYRKHHDYYYDRDYHDYDSHADHEKGGRYYDYWDKWFDGDKEETGYDRYHEDRGKYYEDIVFLNDKDRYEKNYDWDVGEDYSDWKYYWDEDTYDDWDKYDYYYKPRYSYQQENYNWRW